MAGDPCPDSRRHFICPYERPRLIFFTENGSVSSFDQSLVLDKLTDILRELQEIKELLKEKPLD